MVSLAILGMGLAVVMQAVAQGLAVRRAGVETQRLALLARERLDELVIRGEAPVGDEEGEADGMKWKVLRDPSLTGTREGREIAGLRIVVEAASGRSLEAVTLMREPDGEE